MALISWICWLIWDIIIFAWFGFAPNEILLCVIGLVLGGPLLTHLIYWAEHLKECGVETVCGRLKVRDAIERGQLNPAKFFSAEEIESLRKEAVEEENGVATDLFFEDINNLIEEIVEAETAEKDTLEQPDSPRGANEVRKIAILVRNEIRRRSLSRLAA